MSKLFVFTLGFEEKYVVRMLTRHSVEHEDLLLAITGPRTPMSERAIRTLADFLSKYYGSSVGLEVVETNPAAGFGELVETIHDEVSRRLPRFDNALFNLSGGMRTICLAALVAAQILSISHPGKVSVELETEDSSIVIPLPPAVLLLPRAVRELTSEKVAVLSQLFTPSTAKAVAAKLARDESSVRRHLAALASLGLVRPRGERPRKYVATPVGRALVRALSRGEQ